MKICTDCKWCEFDESWDTLICKRPKDPYVNPVNGHQIKKSDWPCSGERQSFCGYEGTYWEAK